MADKTVLELVTEVEKALYQSAGPQVQVYSQDVLAQMIRQGFNHFFRAEFWPQFRKREERTLDGSTGQVTVAPTYITKWDDLQHVFIEGYRRPLPVLPANFNTLGMTGSTPKFIEASGDSKLVTVYPKTSTGDIQLVGRRRPDISAADSEVPCDEDFIVHYSAWSYFIDDGANPEAAAKHQALFEARLKQLRQDALSGAVPLDPYSLHIPNEWVEHEPY